MKKKYDYFEGFKNISALATKAARYLNESLSSFNETNFKACVEKMHKIENDADELKHEMMKNLAHEFITVIEREDIAMLAEELDNVLDVIDDVIRRIYMFNVTKIRPETLEFTALIFDACVALEETVAEFKQFKKSNDIKQKIIIVNTLENNGDALHFTYMHKLYSEKNDTKDIFIWTTIFEELEQCFDACEHAVDVIESVVMKNT